MRRLAAVAAAPALLVLTAASGYFVPASRNKFLPAEGVAPGTELTVKRGDVILRNPVGRAWTAVLGGDVTLAIADKNEVIPAGTDLQVAQAGGDAGRRLEASQVYCSASRLDSGKAAANLLTLGLAGRAHRTGVLTQFCLVDSDGDARVDRAFLVGSKRPEDQKPIPIPPTPVTVAHDVPLPGESEARLRFAGQAGLFDNLGFDLEVVENGKPLSYSNGRTLVSKATLPRDVRVFGASLTVLSYDPATKTARIRVNNGFPAVEYGVSTTTTYIPIYVR